MRKALVPKSKILDFGANTFTTVEKSALLYVIVENRDEPTLESFWDVDEKRYSDKFPHEQTEEVFVMVFERVQLTPYLELVRYIRS